MQKKSQTIGPMLIWTKIKKVTAKMPKILHPGNPKSSHVRVLAVSLWTVSLILSFSWSLYCLGYQSAYLGLVGLPWLAWFIIEKMNGGPINHNSARNLMTYPLTWLVFICSFIGLVLLLLSPRFWIALFPILPIILVGYYGWPQIQNFGRGCYACYKEIPTGPIKICPNCSHEFTDGWVGFKNHWETHHSGQDNYERVWKYMCADHKRKETRD